MESPLATSTRVIARRRRLRERPRTRGRRVLAAVGTLLVHLAFLLVFVLGPAYEPPFHAPPKEDYLQVRLIEKPEPPPPPPVRGTPPKVRGPSHRGRTRPTAVAAQQPTPALVAAPSAKMRAKPPAPVKPLAPKKPQVLRQTPPKVSRSPPPPAPKLEPLAMPPPTMSLPIVIIKDPQPPSFQPVEVRAAQAEGNQPMPPPPSLALQVTAQPALPTIELSTPAVDIVAPPIELAELKTPRMSAEPTAPSEKVTAAKPTPVAPAPLVELPVAPLEMPAPTLDLPAERPSPPVVDLVRPTELANAVPAPPVPVPVERDIPPVEVELAPNLPLSPSPPALPSVVLPEIAVAALPDVPAPSIKVTTPDAAAAAPTPAQSKSADVATDVSTAPDAIPTGRDDAVPGAAASAATPTPSQAPSEPSSDALPSMTRGQGIAADQQGSAAAQKTGSPQGTRRRTVGNYIQVKPHGNTDIMSHSRPGIDYTPTRFEKDWAPANEDAVTGALRRAVQKTEVKHTFHLPRGIRVQCAVNPLIPIALLNCHNPDPPAKPLPQKIYDRLNLPPGQPLVKPAAAASAPAAPAIKLDNGAQCATARIAGGPLPPGCPNDAPIKPMSNPASSSSSWAPASDQFH